MREAALPHGEQLATVIDNIGIGGIADWIRLAAGVYHFLGDFKHLAHTAIDSATKLALRLEVAGLHPTVLIADMTIPEIDRVNHTVPVQGINVVIWLHGHVGTVAHIGADELLRYLSLYPELVI